MMSTLFSIVFLGIVNWFQIFEFGKHLIYPRQAIEISHNKWILMTIQRKTGVRLSRIVVFKSPKMFGMMAGIPGRGVLILSSTLMRVLNKAELEWVLLHEAGHYILWHSIKCTVIEIFCLLSGMYLLYFNPAFRNPIMTAILGFVIAILCIRFMKYIEWEADNFSISRVDNPKGVITAQDKFRTVNNRPKPRWFSLIYWLFYWNIFPETRIAMAQRRLAGNKK